MSGSIFREKSLEKIQSPESLNDYLRVSNPAVWLLLAAVIFLLAGACVWGIFGHIETTVPADAFVENGVIYCYVEAENAGTLQPGMAVHLTGAEGVISSVDTEDGKNYICIVETEADLPDGLREAEIVTQAIRPLSFVMN